MQITNQMIKALAGPPLTVLVLMMVNRTPLSQAFIRRNTGFSNPTIHDAIELLNDYGYVTRSGRYAWQIASGMQQLPLMADLLPDPADPGQDPEYNQDTDQELSCSPAGQDLERDQVALGNSMENGPGAAGQDPSWPGSAAGPGDPVRASQDPSRIQDQGPGDPSGECIDVESYDQAGSLKENENLGKKFLYLIPSSSSRSLTRNKELNTTTRTRTGSAEKIFELLQQCGIREPARSRLAALEHVTVELIQYHCTHSQGPGQAIYRIEHNWPIEGETRAEGAQVNQGNQINKYEAAYLRYAGEVSDG